MIIRELERKDLISFDDPEYDSDSITFIKNNDGCNINIKNDETTIEVALNQNEITLLIQDLNTIIKTRNNPKNNSFKLDDNFLMISYNNWGQPFRKGCRFEACFQDNTFCCDLYDSSIKELISFLETEK